jgi:transcriptional regulator with XRE-family HTH domain
MIGDKLQKLRNERGMTMIQLAELSGLSQAQISRIETGKSKFSFESLEALAQALDVPIKELFDDSDGHETNVAAYDAGPFAEIGERLKLVRNVVGYSQLEFCERARIAPNTYNQLERGNRRPAIENAIALCETYGITLDWIYRGDMGGLSYKTAEAIKALQQARQKGK